jgi:hypothetical protein
MHFRIEIPVPISDLTGFDINDIYTDNSQSFSKANPLNAGTKGKALTSVKDIYDDATLFDKLKGGFKNVYLSGGKLQKVLKSLLYAI